MVLRRKPVRLVDSRAEGGYTDADELICCECGDDPDLDHHDVAPRLRRIRGPYAFSADVAACGQHVTLQHGEQPIAAATGTRQQTGSADVKTG